MLKLNKITTFIVFILASHSGFKAYAIRSNERLTKAACAPANCDTLEGVLLCFSGHREFQRYAHDTAFFKMNSRTRTPAMKEVTVSVGMRAIEHKDTKYRMKYIDMPMNAPIINTKAYEAAKKVAEANRQCMRAFALKNCFPDHDPINKKELHDHVQELINSNEEIYVDGKSYEPEDFQAMLGKEKIELGEKQFRYQRDSIRVTQCLNHKDSREQARSARTRMFCTLAVDSARMNLEKAFPTCTSFDPAEETE